VTAAAGNAQASVAWTAPGSDGGQPITSYVVTSSPGGRTCTWTAGPLSCTVTGLTNGTSYTFTVRALNAVGQGPASALSNAVVPKPGTGYVGLTPARLMETRSGLSTVDGQFNGQGAIGVGGTRNLTVAGRGGVPASASAVVLNVTATQPSTGGFMTVWPTGQSRPTASNLNFDAGQTIPNLVIAKVGSGGQVSFYNNTGSTHVIVDVLGYFPGG
jgi:hypothetical protein